MVVSKNNYTAQNHRLSLSLADFQFPILPWEDGSTSLTMQFGFVEPSVHTVFGQAGPFGESAHGDTVRVRVAEEDFEGAFVSGHFLHREAREER
jgi:hypothetical protein